MATVCVVVSYANTKLLNAGPVGPVDPVLPVEPVEPVDPVSARASR